MNEKFGFTIEERHHNTIVEIECSDMYNDMLENGECEYILGLFNEVISMLSQRLKQDKCSKEFTETESDKLAFVLSMIE